MNAMQVIEKQRLCDARQARCYVLPDSVAIVLRNNPRIRRCLNPLAPNGALFVSEHYDFRRRVTNGVFVHASFDAIPPHEDIPEIIVRLETPSETLQRLLEEPL